MSPESTAQASEISPKAISNIKNMMTERRL